MDDKIIYCPHCEGAIQLKKIHCGIFRHGIYKKTLKQIDSHGSKEFVDNLMRKNKIHGCGQPFRITDNLMVEKSDWI
jgi:major membrane immunogen (membrane-anchored lipoprotein)